MDSPYSKTQIRRFHRPPLGLGLDRSLSSPRPIREPSKRSHELAPEPEEAKRYRARLLVLYITLCGNLIKQHFSLDKQNFVLYSYTPFGPIAVSGCRLPVEELSQEKRQLGGRRPRSGGIRNMRKTHF